MPVIQALPAYLKSNNYVRPTNYKQSPFNYAVHYPGTTFEYAFIHRSYGRAYDLTIKDCFKCHGSWLDVFPGEKLLDDLWFIPSKLTVGIGGGLVR